MTESKKPGRLLALDVMRGITIAGMILVNNPGTWSDIYAPLRHAEWNGLTPTDLVFPFFMFIMGVSSYMSLRKFGFRLSWDAVSKILRRTVVIFLIGLILAWLGLMAGGIASGANLVDTVLSFDRIRILGVLPRLALCYGLASLIALACRVRHLGIIIVGFLIVYAVILIAGNGMEYSENNILAIVDKAILGENHMYTDYVGGQPLKFDPEGLLGTLPSIAHVLIGFLVGKMLTTESDNRERALSVLILGTCLTFSGFLLSYGIPVNKKIWSPTFVLTTCGLASLLLGLLVYVIDIRKHVGWCRFFEVFGINPLALYVFAMVLSIFAGWLVQGVVMWKVLVPSCGGVVELASLLYALIFVGITWLFGFWLYKRRIYIKI